MFKQVGLIAKTEDERVCETLLELAAYLERRGLAYAVENACARVLRGGPLPAADRQTLGADCDLIIVVGGDGTLLGAARSLMGEDVRLLGINLGRLGFLTDVSRHEMTQRLDDVFAGEFEEEERFLLRAVLMRDARELVHDDALNDVVVHKWRVARLIALDTYVDGTFVNTQRSDGLIVSTPTGSTAYAISGGGPILHPAVNAVVLVPICPHTLSNRPIVVDADSRVEIVVTEGQGTSAQLTCDGQTEHELVDGDRILVTKRSQGVRLIHPVGYDFYGTLRTKLHWGREL
jgi:NAD+ kinase